MNEDSTSGLQADYDVDVATGGRADTESTAFNLSVGYRPFRYLAIEAAYHDLGEVTVREPGFCRIVFGPCRADDVVFDIETSGPSLTALGLLPITGQIELYARLGWFFASSDLQVRNSIVSDSYSDDGQLLGIGAQFNWGEHWSARAEFQHVDTLDAFRELELDVISVAVLFRL